jgi:dienelactone hydrolase
MKKNSIILTALGLCFSLSANAQTRYVDEITQDVSVTPNVLYGTNIGIITQAPAQENLYMDVYQPTGDTATNRPVVIVLHTGSFLPAIINGQPTGSKTDNAVVAMCEGFAKKGYVAIAPNYRLGWNPVSPSEDVRRSTLIQAAYRSLQDVKTAVRFLRKSVIDGDNPYGVGDKIAVGGFGTGGYISLSLATLNNYEEELLLPKFIDTSEETIAIYGQPMPYIIQSIMGNFEGTDTGMLPFDSDGDGIPDMEIPFSLPNHVGYSSEVNMVFNAGGALPEISWLEEGEVPIASMQNISDPDAPYAEGNVIVPTTGEFVIVAHGSQLIQEIADSLGNNDVFLELSTTITDAWYANGNGAENAEVAGHDNLSGLFGVITPAPSTTPTVCGLEAVQNAPWDWWDNVAYTTSADVYHDQLPGTMGCLALLSNPDMSEEKGLAFANMLSEFFTPRVFAALNVDGTIESPILNAEELEFFDLSIFPNPAKNELRISTDTEISSYELYDLTGKLIFNNMNVNSKSTTIYRNELNSGLYLTKITDINGNGIIRKIIFE